VASLVALLPGLGVCVARADPAVSESNAGSGAAVVPSLAWTPCGLTVPAVSAGVECSVAELPVDYDQPGGAQVHIAVGRVPARDPVHRMGSLFINLGGPGAPAVSALQTQGAGVFAALNERFDIVGFDPRGVGQSTPAVTCDAEGVNGGPFATPLDPDWPPYVAKAQAFVDDCLTRGVILQHLSTANVARDMDALRAAVGDARLSYFGYSYGTFLGATYAQLFPNGYRALVLDGPIDAQQWIQDPVRDNVEWAAGAEDALGQFLVACEADQVACSGFGGADPALAYDHLVEGADSAPIPATGFPSDPSPVTGDEIREVTYGMLYSKQNWGALALALVEAARGNGTPIRAATYGIFGALGHDGARGLGGPFFAITASEQQYPRGTCRATSTEGRSPGRRSPTSGG